jgi:hypothetical protein
MGEPAYRQKRSPAVAPSEQPANGIGEGAVRQPPLGPGDRPSVLHKRGAAGKPLADPDAGPLAHEAHELPLLPLHLVEAPQRSVAAQQLGEEPSHIASPLLLLPVLVLVVINVLLEERAAGSHRRGLRMWRARRRDLGLGRGIGGRAPAPGGGGCRVLRRGRVARPRRVGLCAADGGRGRTGRRGPERFPPLELEGEALLPLLVLAPAALLSLERRRFGCAEGLVGARVWAGREEGDGPFGVGLHGRGDGGTQGKFGRALKLG